MGSKNAKSVRTYQELNEYIIDDDFLDDAVMVLRALTHHLRLRIIEYIDKNPNTNVNSIYSALNLEQSITSQHLRILRNAELVLFQRNGKQILYRLNYKKLELLVNSTNAFLMAD